MSECMRSTNKKACTVWRKVGWRYRLGAFLLAIVCASVLAAARYVQPEAGGIGTHEQLNLPACGFYERTGYPCITCGMTTSFSHMVRGEVWGSFMVQPAGAIAALICILLVFVGGYVVVTGRDLDKYIFQLEMKWFILLLWFVGIMLVSWGWLCLLTYIKGI